MDFVKRTGQFVMSDQTAPESPNLMDTSSCPVMYLIDASAVPDASLGTPEISDSPTVPNVLPVLDTLALPVMAPVLDTSTSVKKLGPGASYEEKVHEHAS